MVSSLKKATVFGARGFVGRHLSEHLAQSGYLVRPIVRGDNSWRGDDLGRIFYTIGLTADFRARPFDTIDAHVSVLTDILTNSRFESFVYCSSTRVYAGSASTDENELLQVASHNPDHLYNISKLMGEAAVLGSGLSGARVARLSNVFGPGDQSENFLMSVLRAAVRAGHVTLRTSLTSAKDYVSIDDVVSALEVLSGPKAEPITNVACGVNTSHLELLEALATATGATFDVAPDAPTITFPEISTNRIRSILPWKPRALTDAIPSLVQEELVKKAESLPHR